MNTNATIRLITSAALLMSADARLSLGACPSVENVQKLDIAAFEGMWYQIERDPMTPRMWFTDCNYRKYVKDDNGDMDFYYGIYYDLMWYAYDGKGGKMYCPGKGDSTCEASFMGMSRSDVPILATDYINYTLDYDCEEIINIFGLFVLKNDYLMIYARDNNLSKKKLKEVRMVINEKVPDYNYDL